MPEVELVIRRGPGDSGEFVAKTRLSRVDPKEGVGVADLLPGWTQGIVKAGDYMVF